MNGQYQNSMETTHMPPPPIPFEFEKTLVLIVKKMVCNFGTIPINKTKMQAANLILNGDNKVSQNKEYMYPLGH